MLENLNEQNSEFFNKIDGFNLRVEDLLNLGSRNQKVQQKNRKKAILKGIHAEFSQGTRPAMIRPWSQAKQPS